MMVKRSISIKGHRTSIALEPAFWDALDRTAREEEISLPGLIAGIDRQRLGAIPAPGLASALRLFILDRLQQKLSSVGDKTGGGPA